MSSGYYEYRLRELNELIAVSEGKINTEQVEEWKQERNKILYELRHTESLPKTNKE